MAAALALLGASASLAACGQTTTDTVGPPAQTTTVAVPQASGPTPAPPAPQTVLPAAPATVVPASSQAPAFARPPIVRRPIPFGAKRKAEMVAYSRRHYGSFMQPTYRLVHPQVIVEHFTETSTFAQAFNTFAPDHADSELHELPGTCAHFVIDTSGTINQLVPLGVMCRHTVGLNWTAIGIEHVANSGQQFLNDAQQLQASLKLTCWLRSRFNIKARNVIGHNESLSSPLHREDVARLRTQTHNDLTRASMRVYRTSMRRICR